MMFIMYFQPTQPKNEFKSSKMTSSLNNNLSELDTLLQDLSNSRYADKRCKSNIKINN